MGGCGRGICIWLETIILEDAPWLHVVIVWLNDLRLSGVKRHVEMNKGMFLSLRADFRVTATFILFYINNHMEVFSYSFYSSLRVYYCII